MVESEWSELVETEIRYGEHTWELTGTVDVLDRGEILEVEARQVDSVKHRLADLRFAIDGAPGSLNPGNLGEHFHTLVQEGDRHHIVVKKAGRQYRYELRNFSPR